MSLRAIHTNDIRLWSTCLSACPDVRVHSIHDQLSRDVLPVVRERLRNVLSKSLEERLITLNGTRKLPDDMKTQKQKGIFAWASTWTKRGRQAGLTIVVLPDGDISATPEVVFGAVGQYWASTFAAKPISGRYADFILPRSAQKFPVFDYSISIEDVTNLCRHLEDTATGLDGIPYRAWRNAPVPFHRCLLRAFNLWIDSGELPEHFTQCWLWCLPKPQENTTGDPLHAGARRPSDLRPLSGGNTCTRLLASLLRLKIEPLVKKWAIAAQSGFIPGRQMLNNVIDLDSAPQKLLFRINFEIILA